MSSGWFEIEDVDDIASPALLVYPDRVRENIRRMIAVAGGVERLRPHVKTHKMAEMVTMQLDAGIDKFKCSTLAEAEMVAQCGAPDVLYAYQPVGPNLNRLARLVEAFPKTQFSAMVDNPGSLDTIAKAGLPIGLLVDLDVGMHRSGIEPGPAAEELYHRIASYAHLRPAGLHVYEGHIKDLDAAKREQATEEAFAPVWELRRKLIAAGLPVPQVVSGGSPTFAIHARHTVRQLSPGTTVFWDAAYLSKFPELDFLPAALVLTRVISKPTPDVLCVDLGYKSVSPDNLDPRVVFPQLQDVTTVVHSEEHLAIRCSDANQFVIGDCLYGIPWHICPTVALYSEAMIVRGGRAKERWQVVARNRTLTI